MIAFTYAHVGRAAGDRAGYLFAQGMLDATAADRGLDA